MNANSALVEDAVKRRGRHENSRKIKNLEDEVELILSQDEDEEDIDNKNMLLISPSVGGENTAVESKTPKRRMEQALQTPRRSTRKSYKPSQDYEDIISKASFRSAAKENRIVEAESVFNDEPQPRWTPAKVGRVSQKRGRRSRRAGSEKKQVTAQSDSVEMEKNQMNESKSMAERAAGEDEIAETGEGTIGRETSPHKRVGKSKRRNKNTNKSAEKNGENHENGKIADMVVNALPEEEETPKSVEDPTLKVVYETEEQPEILETEEASVKGHFGVYLKVKSVDLTDLGLLPMQEGEPEEAPATSKEVLSLLSNEVSAVVTDESLATECQIDEGSEESEESVMQTLQISDDEDNADEDYRSPLRKAPKIVLIDEDELSRTILPGPPPSQASVQTPKSHSKPYRFPTPYKSKPSFRFQLEDTVKSEEEHDEDKENTNIEGKEDTNSEVKSDGVIVLPVTTMEPKEVVLRNICKRSLSVCIGDGGRAKKDLRPVCTNRVTFYSPANQTTCIDQLDLQIAKSAKKFGAQTAALQDEYVTRRRKRSMSFDESMITGNAKLAQPTPVKAARPTTPKASKLAAPRTKLPNFAAIHQRQFNKMENLFEHVTRKAERAKELINSSTKLKPDSAQKLISPKNRAAAVAAGDKPRALKRINLDTSVKPTARPTAARPMMKKARGTQPVETKEAEEEISAAIRLPNPRLGLVQTPTQDIARAVKRVQRAVHQTMANTSSITNTTAISINNNTKTNSTQKPPFTLSTQVPTKPTISLAAGAHANLNKPPTTGTSTSCLGSSKGFCVGALSSNPSNKTQYEDKTANRRQRHMEMFKGRSANARVGLNSTKQQSVAIRGVRSNRRFELQMQHRQNLEQN